MDDSHFRGRSWTDDQLPEAAASASSWKQALTKLGYREDSGSARATVREHGARLLLDLSHLTAPPSPGQDGAFSAPMAAENLRFAGAYLVAAACAMAGHTVSWPLEPTVYDLLVDTGRTGRQRVQVKTCTRAVDGTYVCWLTRSERARRMQYTVQEIDYFGIVDLDRNVYMVPAEVVAGLSAIHVRQYDSYRLPGPAG